jgi:hypothetical protein
MKLTTHLHLMARLPMGGVMSQLPNSLPFTALSQAVASKKHYLQRLFSKPNLKISDFRTSPPLRSSGQSSWLQIQKSGLDSRRYQIF